MSSNNEPCIGAPAHHRTRGPVEGLPCPLHTAAARPARPGSPRGTGHPPTLLRPSLGLQASGKPPTRPRTRHKPCCHAGRAGTTPAHHRRK